MSGAWVEVEVEGQPGCLGVERGVADMSAARAGVPSHPHPKTIPALQA